jgi:cell division protein FtsI (penicillin-binding protein 3)
MDAMSLLENIGLKVKISGVGKVEHQSLEKGEKLIKGNTITLKLS